MSKFTQFFSKLGRRKPEPKPPTTINRPSRHVVAAVDEPTNTITITDMALIGVAATLVTNDTPFFGGATPDYDSSPSYDSSSSSDYGGGGGDFSGGGSSDSY